MILPKMPYTFAKKAKETVSIRGINRTESAQSGMLRDSAGVHSDMFPALSQSRPFASVAGLDSGVTDIFEHSGILAYVKDGKLYYDGRDIAAVTPGVKQWAVVNTKLCVFPDKLMIDIKDGTVKYMEKDLSWDMAENATTIGTDSISVATVTETVQRDAVQSFNRTGLSGPFAYACTYTYGTDPKAIEQAFRKGEWQGLERYEQLKDICYNNTGKHIEAGDIVIPEKTADGTFKIEGEPYKLSGGVIPPEYYPDKSRYNNDGYYAIITDYVTDLDRGADTTITYTVYKTEGADLMLYNEFEAGDAVNISGTLYGLKDADKIIISGVDKTENALVFPKGAIRNAMYYYILPDMQPSREPLLLSAGGHYIRVELESALVSGSLIYTGWERDSGSTDQWGNLAEGDKVPVFVWDEQKKENIAEYEGVVFDNWADGVVTMQQYETSSGVLTVKVAIPELDYICESENRLWGVSNADGTIYASELGVPHRFFTYDTLSTDSYAVAVGSEDKWTGICSFGGGVCCFKENRLHKIIGSYPAEYYMNEYEIAGVQDGCSRSMVIDNEVLYYKGVMGVYAYTGGTPSLISYELGNTKYNRAVATTDGRCYYIGLCGEKNELMVYDYVHGVWLKQLDGAIDGICCVGGVVHIVSGGAVLSQTGDKAASAWSCEFAPFDEMLFEKKGYSRLVIKAEMAKGAFMSVSVREDNKPWQTVYNKTAISELTLIAPLRIGRCDRFAVKIEGRGEVILRGMLREWASGKE